MPRLGNLWALPSPGGNAKTGMSDSMSPGDFSKLSKSGGVAFRVSFNGRRPPQEALYWRGPVLSLFNGRQWVQSFAAQNISRFSGSRQVVWPSHGQSLRSDPFAPAWLVASKANSPPVEYTITLEPTYQTWLFSLPLVSSLQVNTQGQDMNLGVTRDFRLTSSKPINQRLIYTLRSSTDFYINAKGLSQQERKRGLQLPANYNPQTRANAQQWRETSASDEDYIERVLEHYRQTFIYTLEPPKLGKHTVDEFLWQQQQGFCEHFASSFVVMMRAAGIPARVVTGYQGGEYNAADNYLVIHQYDAHAWTEVWLPGKGWVRIDPTAAVAPERVQQSLGDLQTEGVEGLLSLGRYRHLRLVAQLRQEWDAVNYRWHQLVIGFDGEEQKRFLWSLMGDVSPLKIILLLLGVATTVLGLISLHLWWRNRPEPLNPIDRYFLRFEQLLARRGVSREVGEAPNHFADKAKQTLPKSANAIDNFMLIFNQAQYQQPPIKVRKGFVIAESRILMELRKALKVFRKSTR
jgi:transglutaminase-like putative cysteine protease